VDPLARTTLQYIDLPSLADRLFKLASDRCAAPTCVCRIVLCCIGLPGRVGLKWAVLCSCGLLYLRELLLCEYRYGGEPTVLLHIIFYRSVSHRNTRDANRSTIYKLRKSVLAAYAAAYPDRAGTALFF
jgi:hypothetical protein